MSITKRSFVLAVFFLTALLVLTSYTLVRAANKGSAATHSPTQYESQTQHRET